MSTRAIPSITSVAGADVSVVSSPDLQAIVRGTLHSPISSEERLAAHDVIASTPPPTAAQLAQAKADGLVLRAKLEFAIDSAAPNAATVIETLLLKNRVQPGDVVGFSGATRG